MLGMAAWRRRAVPDPPNRIPSWRIWGRISKLSRPSRRWVSVFLRLSDTVWVDVLSILSVFSSLDDMISVFCWKMGSKKINQGFYQIVADNQDIKTVKRP